MHFVMKKNYTLAVVFFIISILSFAQQEQLIGNGVDEIPRPISGNELKNTFTTNFAKSPGDTLWYEDFGNGFSTNGWIASNNASNGFNWIYTTMAPGGQYSTVIPPIASTTGANGFACLPSDFYNTPTPAGGFLNMDSYLTSGPISIVPKSSIKLRWQQSYRYCCNQVIDEMLVQVSSDGINWTSFNAKPGVSASTSFMGNFEVDISQVARNQSTIYIRFYQNASHYYWMVDDIAVVEGVTEQLELEKSYHSFGSIFREGFFSIVPEFLSQPLTFWGEIRNRGGLTANNVKLKVSVYKNSTIVYEDSSGMVTSQAPLSKDTFYLNNSYQNTDGVGDYTINYLAEGLLPSYNPSMEKDTITYIISDTIFAKDYNIANGIIGPGSYVGGDAAGSMIGTRFNIDNTVNLTSVSYFIASSNLNVGAQFKVKIYKFDTSQSTINGALVLAAQSQNTYTIQASDLGTWVTIRVDTILVPGLYVAAAEQSLASSTAVSFSLGRSRATEDLQPNNQTLFLSNFVYTAGSLQPTWGWITAQPMIRMNFGDLLPVGIKDSKESGNNFRISPNPSNGRFKLDIIADQGNYVLSVAIVLGQEVYAENVAITNRYSKNIELTSLDKGVYFISLNNGITRKVEKIIIQ